MFDAARAWNRLLAQYTLGARVVGQPAHAQAQALLSGWLIGASELREHTFSAHFFGQEVVCKNLWARFLGAQPGRVLLGAHYDTRPWADCDKNIELRKSPVPGANDGGSGVAVLAEFAQGLLARPDRPTVDVVFFDAEDWHDVDGHEVSLGARRFVADLEPADKPDAVVIVDMVGGKNLMLDVDVTCQNHNPSYALTLSLFQLGRQLGLPCCNLAKEHPYKWIGCDQTPFMQAGIPATLLMDLDYPEWHTRQDTPDACDENSLAQVGALLEAFVFGHKAY